MCACWQHGGRTGDAGHLLAAAAAATVMLLDLRRPALPLLTWKHGARMSTRMHLTVPQLSDRNSHAPPGLVCCCQGDLGFLSNNDASCACVALAESQCMLLASNRKGQ